MLITEADHEILSRCCVQCDSCSSPRQSIRSVHWVLYLRKHKISNQSITWQLSSAYKLRRYGQDNTQDFQSVRVVGVGGFSGSEVIGVIRAGLTSSQTADLLGAFTLGMVWKREHIEQASSSGFAEALQHWTVWVGKTLASLMIITILIIYYYSDLLFICYIDFYICTAWDVSHKKFSALVVLTCLSHSCVKSKLYVWCWQGEPSGCMNILLIPDTDYCILACGCFFIHCVGFAFPFAPHSFQETYWSQADALHMSCIYIFIDMQENM